MDESEHAEPTNDDALISSEAMDSEPSYRDRAAANLDRIVQQTKQALANAGIGIDIVFMIPSGGYDRRVITFGTSADPDDKEWSAVIAIVSAVLRDTIGLERSRCQHLMCATTQTDSAA